METGDNAANAANGRREPSSPADIQAALSGGVPMGRWQEGLMFGGINPTPGLASAANWFPRTEELGPGELRITFMGTAPFIRPGQMNTSIFIELGSGDNFVFDLGEGVANYISAGLALSVACHPSTITPVTWNSAPVMTASPLVLRFTPPVAAS